MLGETDPNALRGLRGTARMLTWVMAAIFLLGGGAWAYRAGMDVRREFWQSTRSIRFVTDIRAGFNFGNQVLRCAESEAYLEPMADALAEQSPEVLAKAARPDLIGRKSAAFRRLTTGELLRGIVRFVDSVQQDHTDDQDYDLDYPPLRLAIMTLWARHVQRNHPEMDSYPGSRVEDTSLRQEEDVAAPMLRVNAYCAAASAMLMFALVWLWMKRDAGTNLVRTPHGGWVVPHGIFAFMLATAGFWYAYVTLVHVPPLPAPVVSVNRIQFGRDKATISVIINAQNQDTQWHIDYGPTPVYGHSLPAQYADTSLDDQPFSEDISGLGPGQTVHFRVSATSAGGTTSSDDFSFANKGQSIQVGSPAVGGIVWPTWTVWVRLLVLFIAMVASARILPPVHRGWACGAVAAMLVWFDPLNLIDSHGWPQWDVWILPIFLAAALLASVNWWMAAGILLGVGCMAKGQLLLAGPILMLWPLFEGKWGAAVRIITGFLIGAALVTWPWIVNSAAEMHWIEMTMAAAVLILAVSLLRSRLGQNMRDGLVTPLLGRGGAGATGWEQSLPTFLVLASVVIAAMAITTALTLHGLRTRHAAVSGAAMIFFLLFILLPPWFLRRQYLGFWLASVFAASVWLAFRVFGGSDSWLTLGFAYGSVKHDQMQMSVHFFSNLMSLLADNYRWDIHDMMGTLGFSFTMPGSRRKWTWSSDLDVKTAMAVLYGICLVIAAAAAAIQSRRKDRRFLVALVVPWLVFPMVMCQMGGRYPIWASTISAAMVAVSMELTLLHVVLAVFGFAMVAVQLFSSNAQRWPQLLQLVTPMYPDIAWMLLLLTAIFLVASLVPSRKSNARKVVGG